MSNYPNYHQFSWPVGPTGTKMRECCCQFEHPAKTTKSYYAVVRQIASHLLDNPGFCCRWSEMSGPQLYDTGVVHGGDFEFLRRNGETNEKNRHRELRSDGQKLEDRELEIRCSRLLQFAKRNGVIEGKKSMRVTSQFWKPDSAVCVRFV
jgi:hypothetical protein